VGINISFSVNAPLWKVKLRPYTKTVNAVLGAAFSEMENTDLRKYKKHDFEVAVVLADNDFVRQLNKNYRGMDKPTNVLSFPDFFSDSSDEIAINREYSEINLGDIVLALEKVEAEAKEQKKTFRDHSAHLLVHGFLHLLGYDHLTDKDAEEMEKIEIKILKKLGVNNPYL